MVGIPSPKDRLKAFPHEFSGGMRQRVMIAIAIANNPRVLIADEPTTALDVTIQAQVLEVLHTAQEETGAAVVMITHDLGVVAGMADDIMVMYAGKPVETGTRGRHLLQPADALHHGPARCRAARGRCGENPRWSRSTASRRTSSTRPRAVPSPRVARSPPTPACDGRARRCRDSARQRRRTRPPASSRNPLAATWTSTRSSPPRPCRSPVSTPFRGKNARPCWSSRTSASTSRCLKGALLKRRIGTVKAVDGLSFDIREGECFSIVGESGCGKTTTLLEIMEFHKDQDGEVVIGGLSNKSAADAKTKSRHAPGAADGVPGPHRRPGPAVHRL